MLAHQLQRLAQRRIRADRQRVGDHARLGFLDLADLSSLLLDRQVLVHDADAAHPRHRDGGLRLGHGVHRRRQQRGLERDSTRQQGRDVDVARQHLAVARLEQDIVERQGIADLVARHGGVLWGCIGTAARMQ
jgi:hypothetical protein